MKYTTWLLASLFLLPLSAFAQVAAGTASPLSGLAAYVWLIPIITKFGIDGAQWVADKFAKDIPPAMNNLLCPVIGGLLTTINNAAGAPHIDPWVGLLLGVSGTFFHELVGNMNDSMSRATPVVKTAVTTTLLVALALPLALFQGGCTSAQITAAFNAAKPTAVTLSTTAGYDVARWAYLTHPKIAPAIVGDVQVLLQDSLNKGTALPPQLTAWEAAEAASLGLPQADVTALDGLLQSGIVALQAQYTQEVEAKLGTTATQILTNFAAGVNQAVAAYTAGTLSFEGGGAPAEPLAFDRPEELAT
jgi:hypothetical protein